MKADILKEDQVIRLFETIDTNVGRLSALVNSAGILESQKCFLDINADRMERILATNVIGSFICARKWRPVVSSFLQFLYAQSRFIGAVHKSVFQDKSPFYDIAC